MTMNGIHKSKIQLTLQVLLLITLMPIIAFSNDNVVEIDGCYLKYNGKKVHYGTHKDEWNKVFGPPDKESKNISWLIWSKFGLNVYFSTETNNTGTVSIYLAPMAAESASIEKAYEEDEPNLRNKIRYRSWLAHTKSARIKIRGQILDWQIHPYEFNARLKKHNQPTLFSEDFFGYFGRLPCDNGKSAHLHYLMPDLSILYTMED
ncbi:hypothetical protein KCM76_16025 [Zooshikella marina]|uniref:DUF7738 domain-containing protein n=1 Tax=Zooshikella ganghwensis TaxID=202772 RepID=UPI001BAF05B6|nr:hypothetical protein [Zooshikella ganghwensis]MBU2707502.1 hypothetical protein [Zooshikella ganghwensis]